MTTWNKRGFKQNEEDLKTASSPWVDDGGKAMKVPFDKITGALLTITYAHHEIHEGDSFHCAVSTASIGAETNDHLHLTFTTADVAKKAHMVFYVEASGAVVVTLIEGWATGGTGGSSKPIYNRNRSSSNTSSAIPSVTTGAIAVVGGSTLMTRHIGAGKSSGGGVRQSDEWVLKPNTKYSLRAYDTATGVSAFIEMDWYDHADR